jgi:hypothetical protein
MNFWVTVQVEEPNLARIWPAPAPKPTIIATMIDAPTLAEAKRGVRERMRNEHPQASKIKVLTAELAPDNWQY